MIAEAKLTTDDRTRSTSTQYDLRMSIVTTFRSAAKENGGHLAAVFFTAINDLSNLFRQIIPVNPNTVALRVARLEEQILRRFSRHQFDPLCDLFL